MCTFLGYSENKKAYKVYDMEEQKVVFTVDCTFNETKFPQQRIVFAEGIDETYNEPAAPRQTNQDDVEMGTGNTQPSKEQTLPAQRIDPIRLPGRHTHTIHLKSNTMIQAAAARPPLLPQPHLAPH
ncbi:unnamed protein product [Aphanomyces euteiches]